MNQSNNWSQDIEEWALRNDRLPSKVAGVCLRKGWEPDKYKSHMKKDLFEWLDDWYTLSVKTLKEPATKNKRNPDSGPVTRLFSTREVDDNGVVEDQVGPDALFILTSVSLRLLPSFLVEELAAEGEEGEAYMRELIAGYTFGQSRFYKGPPPPIVLDGDDVLDGGHRIAAAKAAGIREIPAFMRVR